MGPERTLRTVITNGTGGGVVTETPVVIVDRPLPQKPSKNSAFSMFRMGGGGGGGGGKNKKESDTASNKSNNTEGVVEATNKKNASIFARLFARSKSQEETKAAAAALIQKEEIDGPTVPQHKDANNEDTADDLFEIIEKESAELM